MPCYRISLLNINYLFRNTSHKNAKQKNSDHGNIPWKQAMINISDGKCVLRYFKDVSLSETVSVDTATLSSKLKFFVTS